MMKNKLSKRLRENGVNLYLLIPLLLFIVLVPATVPILGIDNVPFLKEYLMVFLLGAGFYPLTACLFSEWQDRGWMFSKIIGLIISATLLGAISRFGNQELTPGLSMAVILFLILLAQVLGLFARDSRRISVPLIVWEEVLFFGLFFLWTYLSGFHPEAYDSEKYVQYGLFRAMERSGSLQVSDIWFQGSKLPQAAIGLWFGAFLTRICSVKASDGFNLYHAFLAACTFTLPFSICYCMVYDKMRLRGELHRMRRDAVWPVTAGVLAGIAACFAGNLHYLVFGLFRNLFRIEGDYWFPDSTRYIGYATSAGLDQTIHEFPAYDFVIGDLSENVCALLVTCFLIGVAYNLLGKDREALRARNFYFAKSAYRNPSVYGFGAAIGLMAAMHRSVVPLYLFFFLLLNYVGCTTLMLRERNDRHTMDGVLAYAGRILQAALAAALIAAPYLMSVNITQIRLAAVEIRSAVGELALLWMLPVFVGTVTAMAVLLRWKRMGVKGSGRSRRFFTEILTPDHFLLLLGLVLLLAILIPEVVYIRDIYEHGYPRAYTMKYYTFEAWMAAAILLGYGGVRLMSWQKEPVLRTIGAVSSILLLLTAGYFYNAAGSWCGSLTDLNAYHGLDVTAYLETLYPEEAPAIRWLDANTDGQKVLLEADAASYSYACRFSALTGHAIPLGWHSHEWALDHSVEEINLREFDVFTLYTSADRAIVTDLLEVYQIDYIIIGPEEQTRYGDQLQTDLLTSLGTVCYQDAYTRIIDIRHES